MINQIMINQFKSIIEDLEMCHSEGKLLQKSLELARLVYENVSIDSEKIKKLQRDDLYLDSLLEIDALAKAINAQLKIMIIHLEEGLKGSEFEKGISSNIQDLDDLKKTLNRTREQFIKLQENQKECEKIKQEIVMIDEQIAPYREVNLEKVEKEKEALQLVLEKFESTKSDELRIYRQHLEENKRIESEIEDVNRLANEISEKLDEMDTRIVINKGKK